MLEASRIGVTAYNANQRAAARAARARRRAALRQSRILAENRRLEKASKDFGWKLQNELVSPLMEEIHRAANDGMTMRERLVHRVVPMLMEHAKKFPK